MKINFNSVTNLRIHEKIVENALDFDGNICQQMDTTVIQLEPLRNPAYCNHHLQDEIHLSDVLDFFYRKQQNEIQSSCDEVVDYFMLLHGVNRHFDFQITYLEHRTPYLQHSRLALFEFISV